MVFNQIRMEFEMCRFLTLVDNYEQLEEN